VLQALDFQNHEPPRISGICDVMVTVRLQSPYRGGSRIAREPRRSGADSRQFPWCTLCLSIANAAGTWGIGHVTGFGPW
jgi:hypothetical protein